MVQGLKQQQRRRRHRWQERQLHISCKGRAIHLTLMQPSLSHTRTRFPTNSFPRIQPRCPPPQAQQELQHSQPHQPGKLTKPRKGSTSTAAPAAATVLSPGRVGVPFCISPRRLVAAPHPPMPQDLLPNFSTALSSGKRPCG